MPTAIVTGGAGFIGSHLAERFLREGWTEIGRASCRERV